MIDLNEVLIGAAKDGNLLVVKSALEKGADINAKNVYSQTVLMLPTINGHTEIVEYLKEKGTKEKEIVEIEKNNPSHVFVNGKRREGLSSIRSLTRPGLLAKVWQLCNLAANGLY